MPRFASGRTVRARRPRPSEKTALRVIPGFSPQGHPSLEGPPRRGGLRTPASEALPPPKDRPVRPPVFRAPVRNHDIPWLELGHSLRTRRAHPSEKTAFRVICGFTPVRPSPRRLAIPRRGGLRTPATTPLALLEHFPGRPPALRLPLGRHAIPGLACGLSTRAHRVRPSEETSLRPCP